MHVSRLASGRQQSLMSDDMFEVIYSTRPQIHRNNQLTYCISSASIKTIGIIS